MPMMPSKRERAERLGTPKAPKMGKLSPQQVKVPPVDDLLAELDEVLPSVAYQFIGMDMESEIKFRPACDINCNCGPCRVGNCALCGVEQAARAGASYNDLMAMKENLGWRP